MNKLFLAIAVVSMSFFASCDKCKDKTCLNSASCDKKTGDCSDVCQNGGTTSTSNGSCSCTEFYNGGTCDNEVRNDWAGEYVGNLTVFTDNYGTNITVANNGAEVTDQSFNIKVTLQPGVISEFNVNGVMSAKDSVVITRTKVPVNIIPGETEAWASGTAYYVDNKMTASILLQGALSGVAVNGAYVGTK